MLTLSQVYEPERRYFCYFQERVELSVVREGLVRKQLATTGAYTEFLGYNGL